MDQRSNSQVGIVGISTQNNGPSGPYDDVEGINYAARGSNAGGSKIWNNEGLV